MKIIERILPPPLPRHPLNGSPLRFYEVSRSPSTRFAIFRGWTNFYVVCEVQTCRNLKIVATLRRKRISVCRNVFLQSKLKIEFGILLKGEQTTEMFLVTYGEYVLLFSNDVFSSRD